MKPSKKIQNLDNAEIKKIIKYTKKILTRAINFGGSSIKNFSSSSGKRDLTSNIFTFMVDRRKSQLKTVKDA